MNDISWKTINTFLMMNPKILVNHHLQSYNDFLKKQGIHHIYLKAIIH